MSSRDVGLRAWADATIASDLPLPVLPPSSGEPELHVIQESEPAPDPDWYHEWTAVEGEWLRFGRTRVGYLLRFPGILDVALDRDAGRLTYDVKGDLSRGEVGDLMVDAVLPLVLSARGRFVLHASAVLAGDGAIAFTGPTGSGKSTVAAALGRAGFPVLSDDALVIDNRAEPVVVPSYPALRVGVDVASALLGVAPSADAGKVRILPADGRVPFTASAAGLRAVFALEPGCHEALVARPMNTADKARCLLSQVFRIDPYNRRHRDRELEQLTRIAAAVPMFTLKVPRALAKLSELPGLFARLKIAA